MTSVSPRPNPEKQAVVITGASTGIGASCAHLLAALGFTVFAGVRSEKDGTALQVGASDRVIPIILDVTLPESIEAAVATVTEQLRDKQLFGVVNNAGIVVAGPLEYLPIEKLRYQMEINTFGAIAVTQSFLPLLRRAGGGRVVMVSSIAGRVSMPFAGSYAASKFAMEALSDALRIELASGGVDVSLVEPGSIKTPLWDKAAQTAENIMADYPTEARTHYGTVYERVKEVSAEAASRGLTPEAVAQVICHALSARCPKTRYVVGKDAKLRLLLKCIPDRWMDKLILRHLGIR